MLVMTMEQRVKLFKSFAKDYIPEKGIQWLVDNGFFIAPCSTKFHLNYEGGLVEHSMNVASSLIDLSKKLNLTWERQESPYIIGLLHDVCKIDSYVYDKEKQQYVWNEKQTMLGHGNKSVALIEQNIMKLTDEEKECILNHMGAFSSDREDWTKYTNGIKKYTNVLWAHTADIYSTHVIEK